MSDWLIDEKMAGTSEQILRGLDVKIAGGPTLRQELLKSAAKETGCKIPAKWSSNKFYAQLWKEGLVTEGRDVIPGWQRQWLITDAGRAALSHNGTRKET